MITLPDNNTHFRVCCDFEGPNVAWTLIESFALSNNTKFSSPFLKWDADINYLMEPDMDYWGAYRLAVNQMRYMRSKSGLFRATCNFPRRNGTLTPDLLIGSLSDVDIFNTTGYISCKKFKFIDIRGYQCTNCTALTYHGDQGHFHIDVTHTYPSCDFQVKVSKLNSDSFGSYAVTDDVFKCTQTPTSTTQWWLGEEM